MCYDADNNLTNLTINTDTEEDNYTIIGTTSTGINSMNTIYDIDFKCSRKRFESRVYVGFFKKRGMFDAIYEEYGDEKAFIFDSAHCIITYSF